MVINHPCDWRSQLFVIFDRLFKGDCVGQEPLNGWPAKAVEADGEEYEEKGHLASLMKIGLVFLVILNWGNEKYHLC